MDAGTITTLVTGPVAALALAIYAVNRLWARVEKMMDSMQVLIVDNTKAMQAMQASNEHMAAAMERLAGEVRMLNGQRDVSQPSMRIQP